MWDRRPDCLHSGRGMLRGAGPCGCPRQRRSHIFCARRMWDRRCRVGETTLPRPLDWHAVFPGPPIVSLCHRRSHISACIKMWDRRCRGADHLCRFHSSYGPTSCHGCGAVAAMTAPVLHFAKTWYRRPGHGCGTVGLTRERLKHWLPGHRDGPTFVPSPPVLPFLDCLGNVGPST